MLKGSPELQTLTTAQPCLSPAQVLTVPVLGGDASSLAAVRDQVRGGRWGQALENGPMWALIEANNTQDARPRCRGLLHARPGLLSKAKCWLRKLL